MRTRIVPFFAVFVLLAVLGIGYAQAYSGSTAGQPSIGLAAAGTPEPPKEWQLTNKFTTEQSKSPVYTITITKPVLQTATGKADAFNKAVEDFLASAASDFKNSAKQAITDASLPGSSLDVSYDLFGSSGGLLSLRFVAYFYISGAAHPASYSHAINYDLNTGEILTLDTLFKPGTKYLDKIAGYCTDDLKRRGLLAFPEGAAAKPENYQNWNLDRGGVLITFDDGQVGPHAQGQSEVLVPYQTLGDLIDFESHAGWWWY
jgi:hypothetical protein